MITSGLVITLSSDPALADQAVAEMRTRPELTAGERHVRWLPLAMEARDDAHSRELHDWLRTLPGVEFVDVVSVNFNDEDPSPAHPNPPQMEIVTGGLPESAGKVPALPVSAPNH
ncbi:MAG: hypothetical protein FJ398_21540 [Verrucomicrobia bacterium]|nr:hypothetical protein [Verrucomicrobiota bacterium]